MATGKKLSDVEIESDDDYELDEIEEHELDVSLYILHKLFNIRFLFLFGFLFCTFLQHRLN